MKATFISDLKLLITLLITDDENKNAGLTLVSTSLFTISVTNGWGSTVEWLNLASCGEAINFYRLLDIWRPRSDISLYTPENFHFGYWLFLLHLVTLRGARWLSGRVSDSGARGRGFKTYRRRVVSLSKTPKVLVNYPGSGGSVPTWLKNCWLGR